MYIDFEKMNGLVPAVVVDADSGQALMQAFMNQEAFNKTKASGFVTFYSRSKKRLWTKGETSGNKIAVVDILVDCDGDSILVKGRPSGPVCHTEKHTCWGEEKEPSSFLHQLDKIIANRRNEPKAESYTAKLFQKGINKIAQKVGEEAVEVVIEAKDNDRELFLNEMADLYYHTIVLLQAKECNLKDVEKVLRERNK